MAISWSTVFSRGSGKVLMDSHPVIVRVETIGRYHGSPAPDLGQTEHIGKNREVEINPGYSQEFREEGFGQCSNKKVRIF